METNMQWHLPIGVVCVCILALAGPCGCGGTVEAEPQGQPVTIGERPAIERHLDQADLTSGKVTPLPPADAARWAG